MDLSIVITDNSDYIRIDTFTPAGLDRQLIDTTKLTPKDIAAYLEAIVGKAACDAFYLQQPQAPTSSQAQGLHNAYIAALDPHYLSGSPTPSEED